MAIADCLLEVETAVGRKLSNDEAEMIFEEVQKREKIARAKNTLDTVDVAIRDAASELAKQMIRAAKIEKRNAAISFIKRSEALEYIKTNFADKPELGLESILTGVNTVKVGSRDSVAARQHTLLTEWGRGLIADLDNAGTLHILTSGEFDRDIARALETIDNPAATPFKGLPEVMKTAEAINKWQETIRMKYNDHGGAVDKQVGYIVRQSHSSDKIRRAGKDTWVDGIIEKLDMARTFEDGADPKEVLGKIYDNFVSGVHLKYKEEVTGFKGGTANLAKKASQERVLHFKDADNWFDYHREYGVGTIADAVTHSMNTAAQNIGLMSKLGPNPSDNFNRIVEYLTMSLKDQPEKLRSLREATKQNGYLNNVFAEVDGTSRIPVDGILANVGSGVRFIQTTSKLGAAVWASITDLSTVMSEMAYQGHSPTSALAESIVSLGSGQRGKDFAIVDAGLGVWTDSQRGAMSGARYAGDDNLPGAMSRLQQVFFKLNGLTWWTDTLRSSTIRMMSHISALSKDLPFEKLSAEMQRVYSLYGIDAGRWEIIRSTATKAVDGREYLLPSAIKDLPDEMFAKYITDTGGKVSPRTISELKDEIKTQFGAYFHDRADFAVLQPDARTRSILQQGTQPGTPVGELLRFIGQFKAFPVAYVQKVLGREVYGRGADPSAGLMDALKSGNGEMMGLAQSFIWSTLFGYMAYNAKDLLRGRYTEKPESAADYAKILQASMLQGGGAGLLGDFMFGEMKSRYGNGPLSSMLGPTFATAESVLDLFGKAKSQAITGKDEHLAASAYRTVINNTPFANLFYTRMAMDYLITYRLQESMNPGYLLRMEETAKREQGKSFLFPPSQTVR